MKDMSVHPSKLARLRLKFHSSFGNLNVVSLLVNNSKSANIR